MHKTIDKGALKEIIKDTLSFKTLLRLSDRAELDLIKKRLAKLEKEISKLKIENRKFRAGGFERTSLRMGEAKKMTANEIAKFPSNILAKAIGVSAETMRLYWRGEELSKETVSYIDTSLKKLKYNQVSKYLNQNYSELKR